jgi:hypothetical protein
MSIDQKFLPNRPKQLDFVAKSEPWCVYELEDGTIIRARLVMTKVTSNGEKAENGLPLYQLGFQQICDMTFPDEVIAAAK